MVANSQFRPRTDPLRVIVTGATGMVGEGVLHECLQHPEVERVLVVGRRACGVTHPKLTEIVFADLFDVSAFADRLQPYDACFFCLGSTSVGMDEAAYTRLTYELTIGMAEAMAARNPDMVFAYISAVGADATEKGKSMWARVKGRTENRLLRLPFKRAYMFRPGYIHPTKGLKRAHKYYALMSWMYPALRRLFPKHVVTLRELGQAMIAVARTGHDRSIVHSREMASLAGTSANKR